MKKNIQLVQSGISLVDQAWGGFYKGGTYLIIGPHKSGRTLLGLQYAMQAARNKEVCLYFTNMRPKDLMIHAASIDFDLQSYMNQNLIVVVRVAPPTDIYDLKNSDDYLIEYLKDIVTVVSQYTPNRVIFDELTPYIGFNNLDVLRSAFLQTIEEIEEKNITSLYLLGEPATTVAQSITEVLTQNVTASIYLQKKEGQPKLQGGKITIIPNIGHTEGQFTAGYSIEPYKGVVDDFRPAVPAAPIPSQASLSATGTGVVPGKVTRETGYQRLSSFNVTAGESYSFSNLYELNDFLLILNNQIALYKSTGQTFNLVSFKLDDYAEQSGILTVNQLQNAIRLATDKKDKICVQGNKIMVLITRSDKKSMQNLLSKIQSNLPVTENENIHNVVDHISVLSVEIDKHGEDVENAESLMRYISEDSQNQGGFDIYNSYNSI
ncbi:MAG: RAD55 family ATPase [Bacteroidota bacterium]